MDKVRRYALYLLVIAGCGGLLFDFGGTIIGPALPYIGPVDENPGSLGLFTTSQIAHLSSAVVNNPRLPGFSSTGPMYGRAGPIIVPPKSNSSPPQPAMTSKYAAYRLTLSMVPPRSVLRQILTEMTFPPFCADAWHAAQSARLWMASSPVSGLPSRIDFAWPSMRVW